MAQRVNLFSLFADTCCAAVEPRALLTVMVVVLAPPPALLLCDGNRARRDNGRNRVLANHLADRVLQQDHGRSKDSI